MARILLLNPGRWGRGITPIWIASHTAILRARGHEVALFDSTFFRDWAQNENAFNTANQQYQPSAYEQQVTFSEIPVRIALHEKVEEFKPEIIFWSALSSHIHGEGEYAAIQFGQELLHSLNHTAVHVSGGLQPTADMEATRNRFPEIDYIIGGESEMVLADFADAHDAKASSFDIPGLVSQQDRSGSAVQRQKLIKDMDSIGPYDYSLFDDQVFLRPYCGEVVRAVDYELSRGCPFTCGYCVETVIQRYYGMIEATPRGALLRPKDYLRHKSPQRIFAEIESLYHDKAVTLFRCQDTNFLTIDRETLQALADLFDTARLPIRLYIETRPEGINEKSLELLKRLQVDGVGMGIELATQGFREEKLNRFSNQGAIERAFNLLRQGGIRRTAYNIIGIPDQDEASIIETIEFNRRLDPDNITVAFFSPYLGTEQQRQGSEKKYFLDYEFDLDSQLRTLTRHAHLGSDLLAFYKQFFVQLVRDPSLEIDNLKKQNGL